MGINKLQIMRQLRESGLSQKETAKRLGVRQQTISKWERKIGKPMRKIKRPEKRELEGLYWEKMLNLKEIGEIFGVSASTILNWMKKYGIPRRKQHWTDKELKVLKQMYPKSPKEKILRKVNRTWEAIVHKMGQMKIRRGSLVPPLERLPNLSLEEKDKVWLACAIDCEASLGVSFTTHTKRRLGRKFYQAYISINNTKRELLEHFRKFVGCVEKTIGYNVKRSENRKNIYSFHIRSAPIIYALLKQIRPYFIIKGTQADLVMEFIELVDASKKANDGRLVYPKRVHKIYKELRMLNKKGKR